MVNNIGHDSSGQHCVDSADFRTDLAGRRITYFEHDIRENELAHRRLQEYFLSIRPSLLLRVFSAIARRLRK